MTRQVKEEKERETSTQFSTVPRGNIKLKTSTSISEEKEEEQEERKSEKSKQGTYSCSNLHCLNEREIKQSLSRLALKYLALSSSAL